MADPKFADGSASIDPNVPVQAGSTGSWTITFRVGGETISPGSAILISIPQGFSPPQIDNPEAPGYVRAQAVHSEACLVPRIEAQSEDGLDLYRGQDSSPGVLLLVERAPLKPSDRLNVVYGAGPGMAFVSPYAGPASFQVFVCSEGRAFPERFFPIREFPTIDVKSRDPSHFEVTAPSTAEPETAVALRVVPRDDLGNRCTGWSGWLDVESNARGVRDPVPRKYDDPEGEGVTVDVGLSDVSDGPVRVSVRESETGLRGRSNPIMIGEPGPYWGDLHACVPEGKDSQSTLDFELGVGPSPTVQKTSFYFQAEGAGGPGFLRFSLPDTESDEMQPSHLLEIYSCWGNRELWGGRRPDIRLDRHPDRTVQAVLAQGIIAGFSAGSNSRFGLAGDARRAEAGRGYPGGLTAVYAPSLTQNALFTALRQRRCYVTTGPRIALQVLVNGHEMGTQVDVGPEDGDVLRERHIMAKVHGTAEVDRIEIVRNNVDVCTFRGDAEDVTFEWTDQQELSRIALPRPLRGGALTCYYFVRVTQSDGEMAWSSPVWFVLRT